MHPRVYQEFERIVAKRGTPGPVLEVGAVPSGDSLLCMAPLRKAERKIGINLAGPFEYEDFRILRGNANHMDCFADGEFSVVLCNSLIEHDKYFWKTVAEIKRVTRPGGLIVIGAPGFRSFRKPRAIRRLMGRYLEPLLAATITLDVHNFPRDYYRFSEQAFEDVIFNQMTEVEIGCIMLPPRIIGAGIKP